ncbi:MAG: aspartate carbamoyltransferase [Bradymonadales bacterium]|nr:aspartate carbamoyltransferase [Bradymonadales bacterium]
MKQDLISVDDLTLSDIQGWLALAAQVDGMPASEKVTRLRGRVLATLFFEPSTRTCLSFESAMYRLGGNVIGFSEIATTSVTKGESLRDTILTVEQYADAIVIRHPKEGSARLAAEISRIPVINAGDGTNQHPTQTLLDLYTLQKSYSRIDGLKIALAGDLKYSRTVHSLVQALIKFEGVAFTLVSPISLMLPEYLKAEIKARGLSCLETTDLREAALACDVVYMPRIQKERFPDLLDYEKVKDAYCIDIEMLAGVPDHLKIFHPLPRVNEIHPDVDGTPYAGYFGQVGNGVIMREAILLKLVGGMP